MTEVGICPSGDEIAETMDAEIERLEAENKRLRTEIEKLHTELSKHMEASNDAAHVIIQTGVDHVDLNRCGCLSCEAVRKGMIEAGYLKPKEAGND